MNSRELHLSTRIVPALNEGTGRALLPKRMGMGQDCRERTAHGLL